MARALASASSQYLEYAGAVVTALPITMACWLRPSSSAATRAVMALHTSGSNNHRLNLSIDNTHTAFLTSRDTAAQTAFAASAMTPGTWGHVAAVFASTTSRTCYFNGAAGTTGTGSNNPSGWGLTSIGRTTTGTPQYLDGDIAETAWWSVALTTADIAQLAAGYCPLFVRPDALVAYVPLVGRSSPEIELSGRQEFVLTNTPVVAAHPRVLYPATPEAPFWGRVAKPPPVLARGTRRGMAHRVSRVA